MQFGLLVTVDDDLILFGDEFGPRDRFFGIAQGIIVGLAKGIGPSD